MYQQGITTDEFEYQVLSAAPDCSQFLALQLPAERFGGIFRNGARPEDFHAGDAAMDEVGGIQIIYNGLNFG
jgi:hypothetical protein